MNEGIAKKLQLVLELGVKGSASIAEAKKAYASLGNTLGRTKSQQDKVKAAFAEEVSMVSKVADATTRLTGDKARLNQVLNSSPWAAASNKAMQLEKSIKLQKSEIKALVSELKLIPQDALKKIGTTSQLDTLVRGLKAVDNALREIKVSAESLKRGGASGTAGYLTGSVKVAGGGDLPPKVGSPAGLMTITPDPKLIGGEKIVIKAWNDVKSAAIAATAEVKKSAAEQAVAVEKVAVATTKVSKAKKEAKTAMVAETQALSNESNVAAFKKGVLDGLDKITKTLKTTINKTTKAVQEESAEVAKLTTMFAGLVKGSKSAAAASEEVDKSNKKASRSASALGGSFKNTRKYMGDLGDATHKNRGVFGYFLRQVEDLRGRTRGLQQFLGALRNEILLFTFALGGAVAALASFFEASRVQEAALKGLGAVALNTGNNMLQATEFARTLASRGLLTVKEAASGLKNLLSAGFGLPEAINLMEALTDAASFNRQGQLGLGEAVVGATEGIKNQNSIMVDNAGITKNLSVMYREYASRIGATAGTLSELQKRTAIYEGVIKESQVFSGNAALVLNTASGAMLQLSAKTALAAVSLGDLMGPAVGTVLRAVNNLVEDILLWAHGNEDLKSSLLSLGREIRTVFEVVVELSKVVLGVIGFFSSTFGGAILSVLKFMLALKVANTLILTFGSSAVATSKSIAVLSTTLKVLNKLMEFTGINALASSLKIASPIKAAERAVVGVMVASSQATGVMGKLRLAMTAAGAGAKVLAAGLKAVLIALWPLLLAGGIFLFVELISRLSEARQKQEEWNAELRKTDLEFLQLTERFKKTSRELISYNANANNYVGTIGTLVRGQLTLLNESVVQLEKARADFGNAILKMHSAQTDAEKEAAMKSVEIAREKYNTLEAKHSEHLAELFRNIEDYNSRLETAASFGEDLLKMLGGDSLFAKMTENIKKRSESLSKVAIGGPEDFLFAEGNKLSIGQNLRLEAERAYQQQHAKLVKEEGSKILAIEKEIANTRLAGLEDSIDLRLKQIKSGYDSERDRVRKQIEDVSIQIANLTSQYNVIMQLHALNMHSLRNSINSTLALLEDDFKRAERGAINMQAQINNLISDTLIREASHSITKGTSIEVERLSKEFVDLFTKSEKQFRVFQEKLKGGTTLSAPELNALDSLNKEFDRRVVSLQQNKAVAANAGFVNLVKELATIRQNTLSNINALQEAINKETAATKANNDMKKAAAQVQGFLNKQLESLNNLYAEIDAAHVRSAAKAIRDERLSLVRNKLLAERIGLQIEANKTLEPTTYLRVREIYEELNLELQVYTQKLMEATKGTEAYGLMLKQVETLRLTAFRNSLMEISKISGEALRSLNEIGSSKSFMSSLLGKDFESDRLKIFDEAARKITELRKIETEGIKGVQLTYLQDLDRYKKTITDKTELKKAELQAYMDAEVKKAEITKETADAINNVNALAAARDIELLQQRRMAYIDYFESLVGGFQDFGGMIYNVTESAAREAQKLVNDQKQQLDDGKINQAQFAENMRRIDDKLRKDREKIWASMGANILRSITRSVGAALIEASVYSTVGAVARAAEASKMALFMSSMAAAANLAPVIGTTLAAGYSASAAAFTGIAAASTADAGINAGLLAAGIGTQVFGGFAAAAIEGNNPGGTFTPVEADEFAEDNDTRRTGGSIRAENLDIYINPIVYINGNQVFIGSGSVSEFVDEIEELMVQTVQSAVDRGEIDLSNVGRRALANG